MSSLLEGVDMPLLVNLENSIIFKASGFSVSVILLIVIPFSTFVLLILDRMPLVIFISAVLNCIVKLFDGSLFSSLARGINLPFNHRLLVLCRGGTGGEQGGGGENGTVTGRACPKGLYGTFCEVCIWFSGYYCLVEFVD